MDRQQIGIVLALRELDLPLKMEGFDDRLILQKTIYLTQACGVDLGYYFQWYLRGPYCSSLANDAFSALTEENQEVDDWELDQASASRLQRILRLFSEQDRQKLARNLERLASTHFMIQRKHVPAENPGAIAQTLERYGKDFTENEVAAALGELTHHDLLKNG